MPDPHNLADPNQLRDRAAECIELAVEEPAQKGVDVLIDLAEDYFRSAAYYENRRLQEVGKA
jgi:hypothetical protein